MYIHSRVSHILTGVNATPLPSPHTTTPGCRSGFLDSVRSGGPTTSGSNLGGVQRRQPSHVRCCPSSKSATIYHIASHHAQTEGCVWGEVMCLMSAGNPHCACIRIYVYLWLTCMYAYTYSLLPIVSASLLYPLSPPAEACHKTPCG